MGPALPLASHTAPQRGSWEKQLVSAADPTQKQNPVSKNRTCVHRRDHRTGNHRVKFRIGRKILRVPPPSWTQSTRPSCHHPPPPRGNQYPHAAVSPFPTAPVTLDPPRRCLGDRYRRSPTPLSEISLRRPLRTLLLAAPSTGYNRLGALRARFSTRLVFLG